jgi:hypothetical protein
LTGVVVRLSFVLDRSTARPLDRSTARRIKAGATRF